jgi:aspartyl-tRNA(Asn)/glutamyl-tRNA(Gln) amidotransferase subunit A
MAWSVEDCAILLQAMAGYDATDPGSADKPVPNYTTDINKGVKGLRIGVIRHFFEADNPVSPATKKGIDDAMDVFRSLGATVRDITLSPLADYHAVGSIILTSEAYAVHQPWLKERFNDYGELFRDRIALGAFMTSSDYVQATRKRRKLCEEVADAFLDCDILVSASQAGEAPKILEVPKWGNLEKPSLTMPFNVTGNPAMSVCSGYGTGGLPVCMQLIAKPFDEITLFQAGHAFETATAGTRQRPAMVM